MMSEFGKVCEHGSLARSCQICEIESALAAMTAERDGLLAKMIERNSELIVANETISAMKSRAERMEKALEWFVDEYERGERKGYDAKITADMVANAKEALDDGKGIA
jgi:hypothetical protein